MVKHVMLATLLFALPIDTVLSQDSKFLLFGPSFGFNTSWRTYDKPTPEFQGNFSHGLEGGLNVFYKSNGRFGLLADLSFLQTKSSITTHDYFTSSEIELDEISKWLTVGGNILYFAMPESKGLPFFGTGLYMAYLEKADLSVCMTSIHGDQQFTATLNKDLDDFRTNKNYFLKIVGGITIDQFDKHRIVLLVTYSRTVGPLTQKPAKSQDLTIFVEEHVLRYSFRNVNSLRLN